VLFVVICVLLLSVLFCVLFVCTVLLPPGVNPIVVGKYMLFVVYVIFYMMLCHVYLLVILLYSFIFKEERMLRVFEKGVDQRGSK